MFIAIQLFTHMLHTKIYTTYLTYMAEVTIRD